MIVPDDDRNMFVDIEAYSYPLFICTRPGMLQRAKIVLMRSRASWASPPPHLFGVQVIRPVAHRDLGAVGWRRGAASKRG